MTKLLKLDFVYLFGLSIFSTIIYGLFINWVLPKFGVSDPLAFRFVWPLYIIFIPTVIKLFQKIIEWKEDFLTNLPQLLFIILYPIFAILGATYLNNTGDGTLALFAIILISIGFLYTLNKNSSTETTFVVSIYSASLAILYSVALRSNYLVGWDIHQEFLVFKLASTINKWDINLFKDAYNACMSITILPTIIRNLTSIPEMDVFRIVFPLMLALIPVVVYKISLRFLGSKLSYAGAFAFLLQQQFFIQLSALLRQGIAFLFYALMIDLLVRADLSKKNKKILFFLFGLALILSHYSTTYISLSIFLIAKIIQIIVVKLFNTNESQSILSLPIIILLFVFTFIWNTLITNTSGGFVRVIKKVVSSLENTFTLENKSTAVKDVLYIKSDNKDFVDKFYDESLEKIKNQDNYKEYRLTPQDVDQSNSISKKDPVVFYFHIVIPWIFRISIVFGFIVMIYDLIKYRLTSIPVVLAMTMLMIILATLILPFVSTYYNLERALQQMLIFLAPISILGLYKIMFWKLGDRTYLIIALVLISYFLNTSFFVDRIGYLFNSFNFNNSGERYLQYYTTDQEIYGLTWLDKSTPVESVIHIDRYTFLRIKAYFTRKYGFIHLQINPVNINSGYVFAGNAVTKSDVVFSEYEGHIIKYKFPEEYMKKNKNIIYSNSGARIYK